MSNPGTRALCVREVQKTLVQSAKKLIEDKIEALGVGILFRVLNDKIITPGDGVIIFQGMQDHTAESVKSLENFIICWVEEAQSLSKRSLVLLRPTIRAENSEIWFSWNPRRKTDAVDEFLRGDDPPDNAIVIEANWRDNNWFPSVLENERQLDLKRYPDRYGHIWEGEYATAFEGAYFAEQLALAKTQNRIGQVPADPVLPVRLFFDIGGAGAKADACSVWGIQFVDQIIKVLSYHEYQGQTIGYIANDLRSNGYQQAQIVLPHDGLNTNNLTGKTYAAHWMDAGWDVFTIKNQGTGAAMQRVEAVRRVFPRCWFNEATTEAGRDALGFYHEKKDEDRDIGMGPEHDWSSHGADAFGLMAVCFEELTIEDDEEEWRLQNDSGRSNVTGY